LSSRLGRYATCKNGEFKFILNYQDHLTKFIQLRPLKSKTAEVVAHPFVKLYFFMNLLPIYFDATIVYRIVINKTIYKKYTIKTILY